MPIPYREASDLDALGAAGYFKVDPAPLVPGYLGALFLINARGEPIEFTYNRIETPHPFLWRRDDVEQYAARQLAISLLSLCPKLPRLILCLAGEVGDSLFSRDVRLSVPVCRVVRAGDPAPTSGAAPVGAGPEGRSGDMAADLSWIPAIPAEDSLEAQLLRELRAHELLLEPFERASAGLREVYGARAQAAP
ncbi:MAG: hypothetical protein WKG32_12370 [Gemmatimonadaceae bacterium]